MKKIKFSTYIISREICLFSLLTYIVLLLAETIKKDVVSFFFNPHILLLFIFLSGFIAVMTYHEEKAADHHSKSSVLSKIFFISVCVLVILGGSLFVLFTTQGLGGIAVILTAIATLIFLIFCLLMYFK